MLFDVDKTFLLPGAMRGIRELKRYYDEHPGTEVLIVGHTDSTGDISYNVKLSRERAQAMASFLRDQVDDWLANYRGGKPAGKQWGAVEDQLMLQQLAGYDGNVDGKIGPKTRDAIRRFQDSAGLPGSGDLDDGTRRELVTRYLAQDGTTLPDGTRLTVHGCGPHHPEDKGEDDEARRRNRRVEIFLSDGPIDPTPGAPEGSEYAAWVRASTETVDFQDAPEEVVELDLLWPAELVERLPDDLQLELSGDELARQAKPKSAGVRDEDWVRFEWRWLDRSKKSNLSASGGGKRVELWKDQICGDLAVPVTWVGDLAVLLTEADDDAGAGAEATGAGKIPDDLGAEDRRLLHPELA
jgi:peptidoglycan hydrolase-like protein with peptidoglycan-binding domain